MFSVISSRLNDPELPNSVKINTNPLPAVLLSLLLAATRSNAVVLNTEYSMLVTTAEGVGAFNSTLSGTQVQTFDNLLGVNKDVVWEGVGTFDQLNVIQADQYGGAPSEKSPTGTAYAVEGIGKVTQTTLKLNASSSYFGLYWSAGDAANDLKFYDKGVLVADFTTANLMSLLPKSYYGNPIQDGYNSGKNAGEPYGFINFFGGTNTTWDTIVFGNNQGSGFEADNYTVRTDGWNPAKDGELPGTPAISLESKGGVQTVAQVTSVKSTGDKLLLTVRDAKTGVTRMLDFAPSAPAAPAPPMIAVVAFVSAIALKGIRRKKVIS
jgi:hypothetical protein